MRHRWRFSPQVSLSQWCKTRARARSRKTFSISALCLTGWNRSCTYRCRLSRHFAVLIPAEFAGKESCGQSWDAPGMQDLSRSLPPRQVHGEVLPPGPADAQQLPELCRYCRSVWQEQLWSAQDPFASFWAG